MLTAQFIMADIEKKDNQEIPELVSQGAAQNQKVQTKIEPEEKQKVSTTTKQSVKPAMA